MNSDFKKQLGQKIQQIRKNKGHSQQEVAQKLNVPRPSVSQIERGLRDLSAEELAKLTEFFSISAQDLLEIKPETDAVCKKTTASITFFRHGEAVDDIYNQYGGWADPELSPKGINNAYLTAQDLKNKEPFEIIYTSPLKRAKQTAEIIGKELGIQVKILQYLKERNTYGLLCGINKKVAQKKFPELVKAYQSGQFVLGSERYQDFVNRLPTIFKYIKKVNYQKVCCVTHGKILTAIIKQLLKMTPASLEDGCMLEIGFDRKELYYIQSQGITFSKGEKK